MIVYTDEQGSQAWLDARRGVITGSRFKDCRDFKQPTAAQKKEGITRGDPSSKMMLYSRDVARERCGGKTQDVYVNAAMRYGTEQESHARIAYEEETGNIVMEAGFICTDDRMFGVSVDGLVGDDGMIEIKTMVSSDTLFTAVVEQDHSEYIDQINGCLWLLGREWCDLVLWAPDLAGIGASLTIRRITRNDDDINALELDLMTFAGLVRQHESKLRTLSRAANIDLLKQAA